jgi:hypothetical protein
MHDDQIETEIEHCLTVLKGPGPQAAYDRARQRIAVLRDALERKSPDSDSYAYAPPINWLDVPK